MTLDSARSLLFAPGSSERKLGKALASDAHGVIADLEDGVVPAERELARETIQRLLGATGHPLRCVRVNPPGEPDFERDAELVAALSGVTVVVPKAMPDALDVLPGTAPIVAIVETPAGLAAARSLAGHPRVAALMLGSLDLSAALGLRPRADGLELLFARSELVLASALAGVRPPFDGPRAELRDASGLEREVELAASLGLGGKACIHPDQVAAVNAGFGASAAQLRWAQAVVDEYEAAARRGSRLAVVGGAMIDEPVVARARAVIANYGPGAAHE